MIFAGSDSEMISKLAKKHSTLFCDSEHKKMLFGHPGGGTSKTTIVVGENKNEFTSSNCNL